MTEQPGTPKSDSDRLVRIETLLEQIVSRDNDHETRIRKLEKIVWIGCGIAAAAGSAVGSLAGKLPVS